MPHTNIIQDAILASPVNKSTLATNINDRLAYVLDGLNVQDFTAANALAVIYQGKVWRLDAADTTSAHDGVTVLVTLDSKRFKANAIDGQSKGVWAVTEFRNGGPASPTAGDMYGVGTSPTGTFAAQSNKIAIALTGGASPVWAFVTPTEGLIAFDKTRDVYRSYTGSAWVDGLQNAFVTGGVPAESLAVPTFIVENATATPPGSPTDGQYYVVAAGATGAWAGQDNKVAKRVSGAWTYYTAAEGWQAWDKTSKRMKIYSSGVWGDFTRPKIVAYPSLQVRSADLTFSGSAITTTTPTNTLGVQLFPEGLNLSQYALAKAGNRLLIRVQGMTITVTTGFWGGLAVFVDGEVNARARMWRLTGDVAGTLNSHLFELEIAVGDTNLHTYNIRVSGSGVLRDATLQFVEIEP